MKFFFADNMDTVNPNFNFETEEAMPERYRQSTDLFAHEMLDTPPYDGILLSHATVTGDNFNSRFSQSQRFRLMREGAHNFYRFPSSTKYFDRHDYPIMGDCGSFSYVNMKQPPITPKDMVEFYSQCQFTHGVSPDHIITRKNKLWDNNKHRPADITARAEITFNYAKQFMELCQKENCDFQPIGSIQFWSPNSAVKYAKLLVDCGYDYIGLGGLAGRPTDEIIEIVSEVKSVISNDVRLHVFGINRLNRLEDFQGLDIYSFDSTSPLIKAFKDDKYNYFSESEQDYIAIRIPNLNEKKNKK